MSDTLDRPAIIHRPTSERVTPGMVLTKSVRGFGQEFILERIEDGVFIVRKAIRGGKGAEQRRTLDYFDCAYEGAEPKTVKIELEFSRKLVIGTTSYTAYSVTRDRVDMGEVFVSKFGRYAYGAGVANGAEAEFAGSRNEFFSFMRMKGA